MFLGQNEGSQVKSKIDTWNDCDFLFEVTTV